MALEIKPPPVLEGKAAREFHERWAEANANAKYGKRKEEARESMRRTRAFLEEQDRINPLP